MAQGVEVGEGEHRLGSGEVLRDPAVARLVEPPEPLDDPEGMLAAGAHPRASPVDLAPARAQVLVPARRAPVHPVAHAGRLEGLAISSFDFLVEEILTLFRIDSCRFVPRNDQMVSIFINLKHFH